MAQPWLHADVGLLVIAPESAYGVPAAAGPGDVSTFTVLYARDMTVKPVIQTVDKPRYGATHRSPGKIPGKQNCDVEFTLPWPEMDPTTYALPGFHIAMLAAGFGYTEEEAAVAPAGVDTVTYKPSTFGTSGQVSATVYCIVYRDGGTTEIWEANGCVFNLELDLTANDESTLKFTGKGLYNLPVDGAISGIADYISPADGLVVQGATVDFGNGPGVDVISDCQVNMNWDVKERVSMGGVGGIAGYMITRMGSCTGSYNLEAGLESTQGLWGEVESAAGNLCYIEAATPQGIYITVEMPDVQKDSPDVTRDGPIKYGVGYSARDNSDAGDDYLGIRLSIISHANQIAGALGTSRLF